MLTRATEPPAEVWYQRLNNLGLTFTGDYRKSLRAMGRLRKNERDRAIGRFCISYTSGFDSRAEKARQRRSVVREPRKTLLERLRHCTGAGGDGADQSAKAVNAAEQLGYPCVLKSRVHRYPT